MNEHGHQHPWQDFEVSVDGNVAYMTYRPLRYLGYGLQVPYRSAAELDELTRIGRYVLADDGINGQFEREPLEELHAITARELREMVGGFVL